MDDLTRLSEQVAMLAPIVAAYVGVAKEFRMPSRYNHLLSLAVAALFVLVPEPVQQTLTTISVIGLTASGVYHFTKKRDKLVIEDSSSDDGTFLSKGAGKP